LLSPVSIGRGSSPFFSSEERSPTNFFPPRHKLVPLPVYRHVFFSQSSSRRQPPCLFSVGGNWGCLNLPFLRMAWFDLLFFFFFTIARRSLLISLACFFQSLFSSFNLPLGFERFTILLCTFNKLQRIATCPLPRSERAEVGSDSSLLSTGSPWLLRYWSPIRCNFRTSSFDTVILFGPMSWPLIRFAPLVLRTPTASSCNFAKSFPRGY